MTAIRFLFDEHVSPQVAKGLQQRRIDASTIHDLHRRGRTDESHLEWAREYGWVMVTSDQDYPRLATGMEHAGIVFYRQRRTSIGRLVRGLEEIWRTETLETMRNAVRYL